MRFKTSYGAVEISKDICDKYKEYAQTPLSSADVEFAASRIKDFIPQNTALLEKELLKLALAEKEGLEEFAKAAKEGNVDMKPKGALMLDEKGNIIHVDKNGKKERIETY